MHYNTEDLSLFPHRDAQQRFHYDATPRFELRPVLEQARKYNKFSHKKATFTLVNVEMQFFTSG
jgi:hypothetical protein